MQEAVNGMAPYMFSTAEEIRVCGQRMKLTT